jgi:glucose/arabinose dehydrogenase
MITFPRHFARRTAPALLLLLTAALAFVWQASDHGHAALATGPGGFVGEFVYGDLPSPVDFAFAPDGRIFVASLTGEVRIIKDGALLPAPFDTLPVNSYGERGLIAITLDPNFGTNGYVYVYYTHETDPADLGGPKSGRVIRITADGDVVLPGSEVVLLGSVLGTPAQPRCELLPIGTDCMPASGLSHVGGALRFAPDGTLLVATGDASFLAPDATLMQTLAQNLDWLGGKMLRINPNDGSGPADNPFFTGDPSANRSKVYAYGFRQPFRFSLRPGTSVPFVGDVGSNYWEEINVVEPGGNYGWPCFEGYAEHPTQKELSFCQALFATEPIVEHPAHVYSREGGSGAAIVGGVFATGSNYPADMSGAYFFSDWIKGAIESLRFDADNNPLLETLQTVLPAAGNPVDIELGLDGDVYYLTWPGGGTGELRRLRYIEGNRSPVAKAGATPRGGLAPLDVQLSSAGSSDPDGDTLSYAWDFDDGGSSSEANPLHSFSANGTYDVSLTVDDGLGGEDIDHVSIIVGDQPPTATIELPYDHTPYEAWDDISLLGSAFDAEDGPLPSSALHWSIGRRHCEPVLGGACHTHPYMEMTGASGSVIAPDQGSDLNSLVIELTATDSAGLTGTASVTIGPDADGDGLFDSEEVLEKGTEPLDPDTDGGGAPDRLDALLGDPLSPADDAALLAADTDIDGCSNGREVGPNAELGGRRDFLNPWDIFDVWSHPFTGPGWERNHIVDLFGDIIGVALRFGTVRGTPPTEAQALAEAALPPIDDTSYHAAFDRGPQVGPDPWMHTGPDGAIDLFNDIFDVAFQFGHSCQVP